MIDNSCYYNAYYKSFPFCSYCSYVYTYVIVQFLFSAKEVCTATLKSMKSSHPSSLLKKCLCYYVFLSQCVGRSKRFAGGLVLCLDSCNNNDILLVVGYNYNLSPIDTYNRISQGDIIKYHQVILIYCNTVVRVLTDIYVRPRESADISVNLTTFM